MNTKEYLTNRAFCPVPWTGLMYNADGAVKNCIRSSTPIANINDDTIEDILAKDHAIKADMAVGQKFSRCNPCYNLEQEKNNLNIISDRVFYLKELRTIDQSLYDTMNFALHAVDVRWSNLCNFACVYCNGEFSSRIASEQNIQIRRPEELKQQAFKEWIFARAGQLKHVYMAGGEPLLMKENLEFLELLKQVNPDVNIRVNTNLSKVDTRIFDLICEFKNVHWTISVETVEAEYEYIRHGGLWTDFLDNLKYIKQLDHKISFNMLHFVLNYRTIFGCVDFLKGIGFHNNSFIIQPLLAPDYLNIRHLDADVLNSVKDELTQRINQQPGFLLENGYRNALAYLNQPIEKNLQHCFEYLKQTDARRNLDSRKIFKDLYKENNHG